MDRLFRCGFSEDRYVVRRQVDGQKIYSVDQRGRFESVLETQKSRVAIFSAIFATVESDSATLGRNAAWRHAVTVQREVVSPK